MTRTHPCPYCKTPTVWEGNKWRPFCSERCKMVDLGLWSMEQYRISGKPTDEGSQADVTPTTESDEDDVD